VIRIGRSELLNYEIPDWWNKKRIENEEITAMRKLVGKKILL